METNHMTSDPEAWSIMWCLKGPECHMFPAKANLNDKEERLLGNKSEKEDESTQR